MAKKSPPSKPTATDRANGLILTAKRLSKRAYAVIHALPRGYRGPALHALLNAAADLASINPDWWRNTGRGQLVITAAKSTGGNQPSRSSKTGNAASKPTRDVHRGKAKLRSSVARKAKVPAAGAQSAQTPEAREATQGAEASQDETLLDAKS